VDETLLAQRVLYATLVTVHCSTQKLGCRIIIEKGQDARGRSRLRGERGAGYRGSSDLAQVL
jgi:hypothetical protein